jgi:hypothetical protein
MVSISDPRWLIIGRVIVAECRASLRWDPAEKLSKTGHGIGGGQETGDRRRETGDRKQKQEDETGNRETGRNGGQEASTWNRSG